FFRHTRTLAQERLGPRPIRSSRRSLIRVTLLARSRVASSLQCCPPTISSIIVGVAVGTTVAWRPPHRAARADLTLPSSSPFGDQMGGAAAGSRDPNTDCAALPIES